MTKTFEDISHQLANENDERKEYLTRHIVIDSIIFWPFDVTFTEFSQNK
jgi:hypothetical protein